MPRMLFSVIVLLILSACSRSQPAPLLSTPVPGLQPEDVAVRFVREQVEKAKALGSIQSIEPAGVESLSSRRPVFGGNTLTEERQVHIDGSDQSGVLSLRFYKTGTRPRWNWISMDLAVRELGAPPDATTPDAEMEFALEQATALRHLQKGETVSVVGEADLASRNILVETRHVRTVTVLVEGGDSPVMVYVDLQKTSGDWAVVGWQMNA